MTTVDATSEPQESVLLEEFDDDTTTAPPQVRRRRRPAPKANAFFRFVFPLIIVAAGVAVMLLWRHGTKVVLDSTDGDLVEIVTDPSAPGYEAFVDPTPTLMVAHVVDGELVGVTVMAQTLLEDGGQAVLVSADLLITADEVDGLDPILLADAYEQGGLSRVEELVAEMFGFGFLETMEVDTDDLRSLMRLVEPIPFALADDLRQETGNGETEIWLGKGQKQLDGAVAAEVYAFRNPGEPDASRNERQLDLWESWLREIGRADDLLAATLPFEDGLSPYLRSLGGGSVDVALLPSLPAQFGDDRPIYDLNDDHRLWLAEKASQMVPLPIAPPRTEQPRVRLLNGTDLPRLRDDALDALVDLGVEVSVIGNASEFGVTRTTVTYHQAAAEAQADTLAAEIGASVTFAENPDLPVDLTIVVGTDWEST